VRKAPLVVDSARLRFLINIDVPDLEAGTRFYVEAFGLHVGRRFAEPWVELLGGPAPIYLLEKKPGKMPAPGVPGRDYRRHWSPVHLDFVVPELDAAVRRAVAAGAVVESAATQEPYGRIAMLADPFGHGVCIIEMNAGGYDAPELYRSPDC